MTNKIKINPGIYYKADIIGVQEEIIDTDNIIKVRKPTQANILQKEDQIKEG